MSKSIAIIPAKLHSRRLPGKNLRLLGGIPLFAHSIRVAVESGRFDKVIFSSDSDEMLKLALEFGAQAVARPPHLCSDSATNFAVCQHILGENLVQADVGMVALLQPTHPFRTKEGLNSALDVFESRPEFDSLVGVKQNRRAFGQLDPSGQWIGHNATGTQRIQAASERHEITGHLFIVRPSRTILAGSMLGSRILGWEIPSNWLDIDIDYEADFQLATAAAVLFGRN